MSVSQTARRRFARIVIAIALVAAAPLVHATDPAFDSRALKQRQDAAMKFIVSTTNPEYAISARRLRKEGSGLYWLHFDHTGCVDAVKIAKSTGERELDQSAVNAFYRWRCQPGKLNQVIIPVTFTMAYRSIGGHPY
jgi:TonB family protein